MQERVEGALLTADEAERTLRTAGDWELWDGVAVLCDPAGGGSGPLGAALCGWLRDARADARSGWVGDASTGFLLRRKPDRLLAPDVSYVSRERLPAWPQQGFAEVAPELVVEIRSPGDSWAYVVERGGIWIAHGVTVVWLVDPARRRVLTLRPAENPAESAAGDSFSAAPVFPDLTIDVDRLFAELD